MTVAAQARPSEGPTAPRRVVLVDDHALVAMAISPAIEADPELHYAGHVHDVTELERRLLSPDLVVLDLMLRDASHPADNVARIRALGAEVLILTSGDNRYLVREALRAPTLGIVRKSAKPADIISAIRAAAFRQDIVSTEWAMTVDTDPEIRSAALTDREREVLSLYASGAGAKNVAHALGITENTVNDHLKRIKSVYQRMGRPANTKVELYRRGMEDGFLPVPNSA
ncbi:response regulator transcription factor [Plantibacter flavus]|uniref:LuxR C-terminal-related transcriptional regulator n=1 Tax=Plantibacter flavus TaxID=150123 RepID=UPI003F16BBF3